MARLKFYENETEMLNSIGFKDRKIRVTKTHTLVVCRKLIRHFKLDFPEISFYGNPDSGAYHHDIKNGWIRFNNYPSYQVIIHELAHYYNLIIYNNSGHNKKLMRTIKKFAKYIMKKNYWEKSDVIW